LKEFKEIVHGELIEVLPPMEDNYHHGLIILHDFEDPFLHNKFAQEYNVQHFLDGNPRTSSFKERGTDVGERSQRPRLNMRLDASLDRPPS